MAADRIDVRVFGPYYGTPPEQRDSEAPLAPPERPARSERMARFLTRRSHRRFVDRGFTP